MRMYFFSLMLFNDAMKPIDEIRRDNLAAIVAEIGGVTALAELLQKSVSQVSQWLNGSANSGTGKARGMRPSSCREIELACKKPLGWMDASHGMARKELVMHELNSQPPNKGDEIGIPQYDTGGSMGPGVLLRDQPGEINGWRVTPEWLQKNVRSHSGAKNLAIVTGFGDSMRGMFNPGDPLLVDRGINTFDGDAVYFFRVGDEGFIKRLQKIPGEGIIASSENKAYRDWTIKPEMDFQVLARVIKVWQSVDF